MIERPLFVATDVGPIAAIATVPDGDPVAAVFMVQGFGSTRAGNNQTFTLLARSLAAEGVASLRADYAGTSESWDADPRERVAGMRGLAEHLRGLAASAPVYVVSSCYGISPSVAVVKEIEVAGVAVVAPIVGAQPWSAHVSHRVRLRQAMGRAAHRVHYGSTARKFRYRDQAEHIDAADALTELVSHAPMLLLAGASDRRLLPGLEWILPRLQQVGQAELEIVDGVVLHAAPTLEAQVATRERIAAWVLRSIATANARP